MIKRLIAFISVLSFSILAIFVPIVRASISWDDINAVIHNTTYYAKECGQTVQTDAGSLSSDAKVYILGDSITAGVATTYKQKFPNATISARVGRSWVTPGQDSAAQVGTQGTGENAFNTDQSAIHDAQAIVIALGTNGGIQSNDPDTIISKFKGVNSSAQIYWVNIAVTAGNVAPYVVPMNTKLKALDAAGTIKVLDYASAIDPGGDGTHDPAKLLGGDGIHPNSSGQIKLIELVTNGLTGNSSKPAGAASYLQDQGSKNFLAKVNRLFNGHASAQAAPANPTDPTSQPTSAPPGQGNLTNLRDQIAQILFVRTDTKQEAIEAIGTYHVGGIFVTNEFSNEMLDPANITEAKSKFSPAPLVSIDEEGGKIDRMKILPSSARQMGTMPPDQVKTAANGAASKMKSAGIGLDFAPVLDIDNPNSDAIGKIDRSFSNNPDVIVEKAKAFADGLTAGGVIPTFKHFPGIGNTTVNSDVTIGNTPALDQLKASDLKPYEKLASSAGNAWVMMSNYNVPGLTNGQPASLSKPAYDLLRKDYKFGGVVVTDDLSAGSLGPVAKYVANPDVVVNAVKAGTDVALFGGEKQLKTIIDKLEAAANADPQLKAQIQASANKVLAAKNGQSGSQAASDCCGGAAQQLAGTDNEQKAWNFFATKDGYKEPFKIAGVLGNMKAESGINPRRVENTPTPGGDSDTPGNAGYGIVQFTPGTKILPELDVYNKASGSSAGPGDLAFQLDLVWRQMEGNSTLNEKAAGDDLKKTTTVEEAEHVFLKEYERAGVEREATRLSFAQDILARYGSGAGAASGSPTGSSGGCSDSNSSSSGAASSIVEVAKKEQAEHGSDCKKGSDCQKKYSDGVEEEWCADFVSWVLKEAGTPFTDGTSGGWRLASVTGVKAWFEKNGGYHDKAGYTPQPGDIQINDNNIAPYNQHVAIVIAVNGNIATIIGGNDGDTVRMSQQPLDAPYITGYGTKVK